MEQSKRKSLAYLPVGLLLFVASYGAYQLGRSYEAADFQAEQYAQREQRETAPRVIRECIGLEPRPFAKCADEARDAAAERKREAQNLAAQQKVATGTGFVIALGIFELALTLWGILVLRDQLVANQRATEVMTEANSVTEQAAEKTVAETRRLGEAQIRCYLTGTSAKFGFTNDGSAVVLCTLKNTGQTPARGVDCLAEISLSAGDDEMERFGDPDAEAERTTRVDIASGVEEEFTITLKATMDRWEPMNGAYFASVLIKVLAKDVFDKPAPETERFIANIKQKPEVNAWVELQRAARLT